MVNYSVVQNILGIAASSYFSKEWNSKVSVKSLNFNILDHLTLRDVELYTPEGDSVYIGEKIAIRFDEFPFSSNGIKVDRVFMKNAYYCFEKYPDDKGINLNFIINHYKHKKDKTDTTRNRFVVSVNKLILRNVEYQMYLPGYEDFPYSNGVNVKDMNFKNINTQMKNIRVDASYVSTTIESFSATEQSGFTLHNLKGSAYVAPNAITLSNMDLLTDDSHLKGSASLLYDSWESMHDYINNVVMIADFEYGSYGGLKDAAYWAPMLWGFDGHVDLEGQCYGTVADLHASHLDITINNHTNIVCNGFIKGLPNIEETVIKAEIDNLSTDANILSHVSLPLSWGKIKIPSIAYKVGKIEMSGLFNSRISDFSAMCNIKTDAGNIVANANISQNDTTNEYQYFGYVTSPNFALTKIFPNNWITTTGFEFSIVGEGFDINNMSVQIENGMLFDTHIRNKKIQDIYITGSLDEQVVETNVTINDSNINLELYGGINMQEKKTNI